MNQKKSRGFAFRLIAIAFPIIISNLVTQVQLLIDKIFLGRLDITCMSAVGNATGPIWTTLNTVFALTTGGTILASQAIGAGREKDARGILASQFKYSNILSAFWFVVWLAGAPLIFRAMGVGADVIDMSISYARIYTPVMLTTGVCGAMNSVLQVNEKTKIMIVYGVIRSALNVLLDYCMIFGHFGLPAMGVSGAALATTIAELTGSVIILFYVKLEKTLRIKPSWLEIRAAVFRPYMDAIRVGIPSALEEFAWNLGNMFLIVMLNRVSAVAAGVYTIVFSVELIPIVFFTGMGQAAMTLSGQETGRKNVDGIIRIVRIALGMCLALAAVILILLKVFPGDIMSWFTTDAGIIAAAGLYLLIVGIDLFPKSGNIIVGAGIRGYGDTKWMLYTQLFGTVFVVGGSATLIIGLGQGMESLFWLVVADETFRVILNAVHLGRIRTKNDREIRPEAPVIVD